jgi:2'-5' RNA ligase
MHKISGGRMTRPENLHLTLAFLGPTDATRLAELEAVAASVKTVNCAISLDEAGYWKHNHIVWAGSSKVPDKLATMVQELRDALKKNGFRFDPKPFKPHVTLIRDAKDPGVPPKKSIRWKVGGFSLVRAYRDDQGLLYRVVSSCPKAE